MCDGQSPLLISYELKIPKKKTIKEKWEISLPLAERVRSEMTPLSLHSPPPADPQPGTSQHPGPAGTDQQSSESD